MKVYRFIVIGQEVLSWSEEAVLDTGYVSQNGGVVAKKELVTRRGQRDAPVSPPSLSCRPCGCPNFPIFPLLESASPHLSFLKLTSSCYFFSEESSRFSIFFLQRGPSPLPAVLSLEGSVPTRFEVARWKRPKFVDMATFCSGVQVGCGAIEALSVCFGKVFVGELT